MCPGGSPTTPPGVWGEEQQAVYRFSRQVPAEGLQGLVALWLLHYPEQAREALDWTVHNQGWLTEQVAWEHELVALLQGLEGDERSFIGVKLTEILSDIGVPQADDVLRMLEHEGGA